MLRIVLMAPFGRKKVVIAAAATGIGPAGRWSRAIDRAVTCVRIEELADFSKVRVRFSPHRVFLIVAWDGEFLLCVAEAEVKVLRDALKIALGQRDDLIGAAKAGTAGTVIHTTPTLEGAHRIQERSLNVTRTIGLARRSTQG